MVRKWMVAGLLLPVVLCAQDFPFEQQFDTIPVEIEGWQPHQPWSFGLTESTPRMCDIDADGDNDLFLGKFGDLISYYENRGTPSLADFKFISSAFDSIETLPEAGNSSYPEFCDIDNDGDLDLFNGGGYVGIYTNEGTPEVFSFNEGDTLKDMNQDNVYGWHLAFIDIDGDGDYDLFNGHFQGFIMFYRNIGNADNYEFFLETMNWEGIDVGNHADLTFSDIDADNDYDLFIGDLTGKVRFYQNIGDSTTCNFDDPVYNWLGIDVGEHASPEFSDIDGDGDYDLFVGREPTGTNQHMGDVFFYENIGNPEELDFQHITSNYLTIDVGLGCHPQLIDIDADTDLDLFVGASDEIRFFRNIGNEQNPSFSLEEEYYQGISLESIMPHFCDFDADGDFDLFAGMGEIPGPPGLHLYINRGSPEQAEFVLYSDDFVPANYLVMVVPTLADIDADDDYDLFVTDNAATNIWYFENVGTPQWPIYADPVMSWQGIALQSSIQRQIRFFDLDEDGDLDLFFSNNWNEPGGKGLRYYENVGTPITPLLQLVTYNYLEMQLINPIPWFSDIDDDGYMDLFVGEDLGGILFFHGIDDSSGYVPPYFPPCPYPCIKISFGPNPVNPTTWITFNLPYPQRATLAVYNLLGQKVTTLAQGLQPPGVRTVYWNSSQVSSGIYLIEMETEMGSTVKRLAVLK